NFVITDWGEILIAREDFEFIKHTSLAAGLTVWSAGQLGIQASTIRLVDLQSGHYVKPNVMPGTTLAHELTSFTDAVFKEYSAHFGLTCLHANFHCLFD